ncbi:MAG: hypothetical protein FJZ16_02080, partial [Candidatus Omnitrophica bacterium]|nr:hypothetical protein [Candidatus Omnitrophota bacterium]
METLVKTLAEKQKGLKHRLPLDTFLETAERFLPEVRLETITSIFNKGKGEEIIAILRSGLIRYLGEEAEANIDKKELTFLAHELLPGLIKTASIDELRVVLVMAKALGVDIGQIKNTSLLSKWVNLIHRIGKENLSKLLSSWLESGKDKSDLDELLDKLSYLSDLIKNYGIDIFVKVIANEKTKEVFRQFTALGGFSPFIRDKDDLGTLIEALSFKTNRTPALQGKATFSINIKWLLSFFKQIEINISTPLLFKLAVEILISAIDWSRKDLLPEEYYQLSPALLTVAKLEIVYELADRLTKRELTIEDILKDTPGAIKQTRFLTDENLGASLLKAEKRDVARNVPTLGGKVYRIRENGSLAGQGEWEGYFAIAESICGYRIEDLFIPLGLSFVRTGFLRGEGEESVVYLILPFSYSPEVRAALADCLTRLDILGEEFLDQVSLQGRLDDRAKYIYYALTGYRLARSQFGMTHPKIDYSELQSPFTAPWGVLGPLVHEGLPIPPVGEGGIKAEGRTDLLDRRTLGRDYPLAVREYSIFQTLAYWLYTAMNVKEPKTEEEYRAIAAWKALQEEMDLFFGKANLSDVLSVPWFIKPRKVEGWVELREEAPGEPIMASLAQFFKAIKESDVICQNIATLPEALIFDGRLFLSKDTPHFNTLVDAVKELNITQILQELYGGLYIEMICFNLNLNPSFTGLAEVQLEQIEQDGVLHKILVVNLSPKLFLTDDTNAIKDALRLAVHNKVLEEALKLLGQYIEEALRPQLSAVSLDCKDSKFLLKDSDQIIHTFNTL